MLTDLFFFKLIRILKIDNNYFVNSLIFSVPLCLCGKGF